MNHTTLEWDENKQLSVRRIVQAVVHINDVMLCPRKHRKIYSSHESKHTCRSRQLQRVTG